MRFNPKPNQIEAVSAVVDALKHTDRTHIVSPCGTGKTYVGELVANALSAKSVVLFFPSIALIKQTLAFWREIGSLDGASCLCVCSDKSVADSDDVVVTEGELGMHITTSSSEVSSFFSAAKGKAIVFCTYQSSPVLAGGMPSGFSFDLGLFDESHRTVSPEVSLFSFSLDNNNIKIAKRVFMTATPKHIVDDGRGGFSMDDEAVYGKRAYTLPIRDAISQGLISDYQVLVSVITSADLARELGAGSKGGVSEKRMLANAVAVKKAMEQTGAKKVFSFHSTVKAASAFSTSELVKQSIGARLLHVSGAMSAGKRHQIISDFADADCSLVTNARCLTEGVDVPAVDMVCFMDAKESTIDIVQAAGRAMRTAEGKSMGYILLPVFLELDKFDGDIEGAIKASGMSIIWDVISRMTEQESMVSLKNSSKNEVREARKNKIEYKVIAANGEIIDRMMDSIDVYYASRNASVFDDNYKQLVEFKNKHGHCNPTKDEDPKLCLWIKRVRFNEKQGRLSKENKDRMDALGFYWDGRDYQWHENFNLFVKGKAKDKWMQVQRAEWRVGSMKPDRLKLLEDAGFPFEPKAHVRPRLNVSQVEISGDISGVFINDDDDDELWDRERGLWAEHLSSVEDGRDAVVLSIMELNQVRFSYVDRDPDIHLLIAALDAFYRSVWDPNWRNKHDVEDCCVKLTSKAHAAIFERVTGIKLLNGLIDLRVFLKGLVSLDVWDELKLVELEKNPIMGGNEPVRTFMKGKMSDQLWHCAVYLTMRAEFVLCRNPMKKIKSWNVVDRELIENMLEVKPVIRCSYFMHSNNGFIEDKR